METKNVMNKIIDGTNVGSMKTELNEKKVLLNSIDSATCQYEQKIAISNEELKKVKKTILEEKSATLARAKAKYETDKKELTDAKEEALVKLNGAVSTIDSFTKQLNNSNEIIKMAKEGLSKNEKELATSEEIMGEIVTTYRAELGDFEFGFENGVLAINGRSEFFSIEDIKEINRLTNKIIKSKTKIEEAKATAMRNAKNAFDVAEAKHKDHKEDILFAIDRAKSTIEEEEKNIDMTSKHIEDATAIKAAHEETYNAIIIKLERLEKAYNDEIALFEKLFKTCKINLVDVQFLSSEDITLLNTLLSKYIEVRTDIKSYTAKIEENNSERGSIVNQIEQLEVRVDEVTKAREKCIETVGNVADEAIKVTTKTISEVAGNVGKGLRGASVVGKFAFDQAKKYAGKKASKVINDLAQDGFFENETEKNAASPDINIDLKGTIQEGMKNITENPIIGGLVDGLKESELTKEDVLKAGKSLLEDAKKELLGEFSDKKPEELRDEVQDGVKKFFKQFKGYANPSVDNTENNDTDNEE